MLIIDIVAKEVEVEMYTPCYNSSTEVVQVAPQVSYPLPRKGHCLALCLYHHHLGLHCLTLHYIRLVKGDHMMMGKRVLEAVKVGQSVPEWEVIPFQILVDNLHKPVGL